MTPLKNFSYDGSGSGGHSVHALSIEFVTLGTDEPNMNSNN